MDRSPRGKCWQPLKPLLSESPVSVTFSLQSRIKLLFSEISYFHLCFAQQKRRISMWRHNRSRMLEEGFSARCNVAAVSINFWLCPQSVIPGLAMSYGKAATHLTRLVCHRYWTFGSGTVKSHGNNTSVLHGKADVIMRASKLIIENSSKSSSSEKFVRRGVSKQSFYFRRKAED